MKLAISDVWKWAAKDKDGAWTFYQIQPSIEESEWTYKIDADKLWYDDGIINNANTIISDFPDCDWQDSLHRIVNGELVKHVELKVDDKVMVRNSPCQRWHRWHRRHFSGFDQDGRIRCIDSGFSSWTCDGTTAWDEWRLPTPEELA